MINIPEAGKFTFMDGGCLDEVTKQKLSGKITDEEYKRKIESVKRFERQLSDNGYLVIKFFFHIGEQEQRKRLTRLLDDKNTRWRVSEYDWWQNQHYKKSLKHLTSSLMIQASQLHHGTLLMLQTKNGHSSRY